jgi:hypothetical protein
MFIIQGLKFFLFLIKLYSLQNYEKTKQQPKIAYFVIALRPCNVFMNLWGLKNIIVI